jgi:transcription initiation factor TFIIIB Brf1 subunit/transcription initiation factor TFIIB
MPIKYFTDNNGTKFVVEKTTETGFLVHKTQGVGESVSNSFEITYDDIISDFNIENVKFFPEGTVTDLHSLSSLIKVFKRDAKLKRLEDAEKQRKLDEEQREKDRVEAEKQAEINLAERKRKAKALKLKLELDNE